MVVILLALILTCLHALHEVRSYKLELENENKLAGFGSVSFLLRGLWVVSIGYEDGTMSRNIPHDFVIIEYGF